MNRKKFAVACLALTTAQGLGSASLHAATPRTTRASLSSGEVQGNDGSSVPSLSADGRYVAFASNASNLVAGDTSVCEADPDGNPGPCVDVFVRDQTAGTTQIVSVSTTGAKGNDHSSSPLISGDGRYVAFESMASNLTPGDAGGLDVFVRDRTARVTTRESFMPDGAATLHASLLGMSSTGRYLLFYAVAQTGGEFGVYVRDRTAATTTRISAGIGTSGAVSSDGRYIVFTAYNVQPDPRPNPNYRNVFRHDRVAGTTVLVSGAAAGLLANSDYYSQSVSNDGRYVAFVGGSHEPYSENPSQAYVRDMTSGSTRLVSTTPEGAPGNETTWEAVISGDGRVIAFTSDATDLMPCELDVCLPPDPLNPTSHVYVRNRTGGAVSEVSVSTKGKRANNLSEVPAISRTGRYVAFGSFASNLTGNDTNGVEDVFVRDRAV